MFITFNICRMDKIRPTEVRRRSICFCQWRWHILYKNKGLMVITDWGLWLRDPGQSPAMANISDLVVSGHSSLPGLCGMGLKMRHLRSKCVCTPRMQSNISPLYHHLLWHCWDLAWILPKVLNIFRTFVLSVKPLFTITSARNPPMLHTTSLKKNGSADQTPFWKQNY